MYNIYNLGTLVRVRAPFKVAGDDSAIDPDAVMLSVRTPLGAVATYTYGEDAQIERDDTGIYHAEIDASVAGAWHYRWWSTGNGQAAEEKRFTVRGAEAV